MASFTARAVALLCVAGLAARGTPFLGIRPSLPSLPTSSPSFVSNVVGSILPGEVGKPPPVLGAALDLGKGALDKGTGAAGAALDLGKGALDKGTEAAGAAVGNTAQALGVDRASMVKAAVRAAARALWQALKSTLDTGRNQVYSFWTRTIG